MHRRKFLKSVPVVVVPSVSGCVGWNVKPSGFQGYSLKFKPIESRGLYPCIARKEDSLIPSPLIRDFISKLLNGEDIDVEVNNFELFQSGSHETFFHYWDGTSFYRIDKTTLETGTVTGLQYEVTRKGSSQDVPEENVLSMLDLPYCDQLLLHNSLFILDSGEMGVFSNTFVAGYLNSEYQASSLLANGVDKEFIEFNGQYMELEEQGESSVTKDRVRYSAKAVAKSETEFHGYLIDKYGIEATELSADAQDLLSRVKQNGGELTLYKDEEDFELQEQTLKEIQSIDAKITEMNDWDNPYACSTQLLYIQYEGEEYVFYSGELRY